MKDVPLVIYGAGPRDPQELDPETMQFRDQAAVNECQGCVFARQWMKVCQRASAVAVRAGLRDCDEGVIYVAVEKDPRQVDLVDAFK